MSNDAVGKLSRAGKGNNDAVALRKPIAVEPKELSNDALEAIAIVRFSRAP